MAPDGYEVFLCQLYSCHSNKLLHCIPVSITRRLGIHHASGSRQSSCMARNILLQHHDFLPRLARQGLRHTYRFSVPRDLSISILSSTKLNLTEQFCDFSRMFSLLSLLRHSTRFEYNFNKCGVHEVHSLQSPLLRLIPIIKSRYTDKCGNLFLIFVQ